jgi:hypothetical protein
MRDYAEVYLEVVQTLRSFYNNELKGNSEEAHKIAIRTAELAKELVDITK